MQQGCELAGTIARHIMQRAAELGVGENSEEGHLLSDASIGLSRTHFFGEGS
jgi:hypothetical protein